MWNDLFLYFILPVSVVIGIIRFKSVQDFLQPLRNRLYYRNIASTKHSHSHAHGESFLDNEGKNQAKDILFKDLKTTNSKVKELEGKGMIRILEIGVGSGANFKYYPEKCQFIGVDPNDCFRQDATDNLKKFPGIEVLDFVQHGAEDMNSITDGSVDAVVGTTVLCSVKDLRKVFKEIRRVLVSGGRYYYMEHVAEPSNSIKYWLQKIVVVVRNVVSFTGLTHGVNLNRDIDQELLMAGFSTVEKVYSRFEFNDSILLKLARRHELGIAVK